MMPLGDVARKYVDGAAWATGEQWHGDPSMQ
jgi:hypothetical protein